MTGATGFVGGRLLSRLSAGPGHVAALARRQPGRTLEDTASVHWIEGGLEDPAAIGTLIRDADVVVHVAGLTKARSPDEYYKANTLGTASLLAAAGRAGVRHFILVSSLAADRPTVSAYARSKAVAEWAARHHGDGMTVTIVRAPVVLGPKDPATEPLFRAISRGLLPVPKIPDGPPRFSLIDVEDLAGVLQALTVAVSPSARHIAPCGHREVTWSDIAAATARVTGRRIRTIPIPISLLMASGWAADGVALARGRATVFSSGKVNEMLAGDWIARDPIEAPTPLDATLERCLASFRHGTHGGAKLPNHPSSRT